MPVYLPFVAFSFTKTVETAYCSMQTAKRLVLALVTRIALLAALCFGCSDSTNVQAEDRAELTTRSNTAADFFELLEDECIEVQFIPLASSHANVIVTNRTNRELEIQLPSAFGAIHVLGQFAPRGGRLGGGQGVAPGGGQPGFPQNGIMPGGFAQGGGQQGLGQNLGGGFGRGNFGQGQNGNLGPGFGRGLFRLEPDASKKLSVDTVCLQYGRPDPRPTMRYKLVPLAEVCPAESLEHETIVRLCQELGRNEISQRAAQAIAWKLTNDLDWNSLEKLYRRRSRYTGNELMFSTKEIHEAKRWVERQQERDDQSSATTYSMN